MTETVIEPQPASISYTSTSDANILTAAKSSGITFIGTWLGYAGRFVLGILLARFMGAEQYGLYSLADTATYMVIGIASLGLDIGIVHFVPIFVSRRDEESLWGTLQVGLGLRLFVSLLGGICLFAFANPLAKAVFHEPGLAPLLRIVAFAIPCGALAAAAVAVTRGLKLMQYKVIAEDISLTLVKLILISLLAFTGLNAIKAITAYSLAMAVSCIMLVYFVYRLLPSNRPSGSGFHNAKRVLGFSLPVYLTQLLTMFGPSLRTMLLGALNTVTSVGIFTAAARISVIGTAFHNSVAVTSWPIVSDLYDREEREQLGHFYRTITKWTFTFNLPMFLLILVFSRPILSVFGESFMAGSIALVILACGDLVNAATGISGSMVTMTGNTWLNAGNSIVTLALTLTLSVLLIPSLGIVGAAIATAADVIIIKLIQVLEVYVLFRLLPYNRSFVKPVVAGILSATATYAMVHWVFTAANLVTTVLSMGTLLATYASAILLLGLSEEDQMVLKRLYAHLSRVAILKKGLR